MIPALITALLLDAIFGEPKYLWNRLPHPAVLMGRAVAMADRHLNYGALRKPNGSLAVALLTLSALATGAILSALPGQAVEIVLGAVLLAQRSLSDHVRAVADAFSAGLPAARRAVSMIVGRMTDEMTEEEVSRAAIESAAENFSDGVVAPAFWFVIGGLPGIIFYKTINTADSMIGHRSERYAQFGWAAAKLDDLLNWIPARLSALLLAPRMVLGLRHDAQTHASPNAGYPEAAMAHALGIRLGGPRAYAGVCHEADWIHAHGHPAQRSDIQRANRQIWRAWGRGIALLALAALITA